MQEQITGILSRDRIERLAPDQASLSAALKLMKPANWPVLSCEAGEPLLWGECQGSGATPYRVVVTPADLGYKCSCPSRKFPCKHALALMWMACESPAVFAPTSAPAWATEWLARRRPGSAAGRPAAQGGATSLAEAAASASLEDDRRSDPKAAARAEAQRRRLREEREAAVLSGLDELDRWIADQLSLGLAGFAQRAGRSVRALVARLVDNKAQGLANRLDMLSSDLFRAPQAIREDLLIERLAGLVLLSAAYRNQDRLPTTLREDVRRAVGWTVKREELLSDPTAPRLASNWIVVATRSETQPDALRRLETWLIDAANPDGVVRLATLIDFAPASAGAVSPFEAGESIAGQLVYYPSATPLRGLLATRSIGDPALRWPALPRGLSASLVGYEAAVASQPWIEAWPLAASGLSVARLSSDRLALTDPEGVVAPLDIRQTSDLLPLLGLDTLSAIAVWDGRFAYLLAAETPIGPWRGA